MTEPVRLQLSRRKGFDLQALSRATNGLAAVNVARPTMWGNPFKVGVDGTARECVAWFRASRGAPAFKAEDRAALAGHNLACWCRPGEPCHGDVLLELAQAEVAA